jgi:hypothetical protein
MREGYLLDGLVLEFLEPLDDFLLEYLELLGHFLDGFPQSDEEYGLGLLEGFELLGVILEFALVLLFQRFDVELEGLGGVSFVLVLAAH